MYQVKSLTASTAYQHLTRTVEVSRVHLFDILTQYRAIFPDDDSTYHSSLATPTLVDGALFYTWLGSKVSDKHSNKIPSLYVQVHHVGMKEEERDYFSCFL